MWKEVPAEKWVVDLTTKEGQPLGFQVFGDRKDAENSCREILRAEGNVIQEMRGYIRKWEGMEQVYVENDN